MAQIGHNSELAAQLLRQGKLVAIPTETVYGLAANGLNEKAILSVFEAKQRPFFDPLILHVPSLEAAKTYATFNDKPLLQLAEHFWPGPLTILLPKNVLVSALITSGLERVALRVPQHPLTLQLLQGLDFPLAAPSANPFGYVSPTRAEHVNKQLGDKIDYILDGGPCQVGLESTIVGIEDNKLCIYRLGGLALEEIVKVAGPYELRINNSSDPKAPGQLKNHYAPKKPLFVGDLIELIKEHPSKKTALITFGETDFAKDSLLVFNLSPTKNLQEAALNLFNFLRQADESEADVVLCSKLPESGLGLAINDRLRRASVQ